MEEKFHSFEDMKLAVFSLHRFRASQNGDIGKHLLCIRKRPWCSASHRVYASEYTNFRMQGVSISNGGRGAGRGGAERGRARQECPSQTPSIYLPPVAAANRLPRYFARRRDFAIVESYNV